MPWVPELFSAPALAGLEAKQGRRVVDVLYFDGLAAGEVDALVASFAGEPRVRHPLRGDVEGEYEFREFVADTERWLRENGATVEDVQRSVLERRGFEEVVVHLDTAAGPVELPHGLVADHGPEGRIEELRIYFDPRLLTGQATRRAPLLPADPELRLPPPAVEYERGLAAAGIELEPCVLIEDGDTCALEYNVRPVGADPPDPRAGFSVLVRGDGGTLAAVREYDELSSPGTPI